MNETLKIVTDQYGVGKDLIFEQTAPQPEPQTQKTKKHKLQTLTQTQIKNYQKLNC